MTKYAFTFLACLLLLTSKAVAHPHVWADTTLELLVEDSQIIGLRAQWSFDALYSASFLAEADTNNNKKLDADEAQETIDSVFTDGQADLYPFMHVAPGAQKLAFTLKNPAIRMEDESLIYTFNLMLKTPMPLAGTHEFGMYDPDFYVAFEQALEMKLPADVQCTQDLQENPNISIYYDLVNPETYTLTCI